MTDQSNNLEVYKNHFLDRLDLYMHSVATPSSKLLDAVKYVTLNQGKSLRPLMVYATGALLGCDLKKLDAPALAVELLHTYSLVHDDLPAMDDDDLRRGQPSCHKAFDEATAILVGDALQSLSVQLLLDSPDHTLEQKVLMAQTLLNASGINGMVAGQSLDLLYLNHKDLTEDTLKTIHQLKTGELFTASVLLACDANDIAASMPLYLALKDYSFYLGMAFQIQDDYLDEYGETKTLGKSQGSDNQQGKITYTHFYDKTALLELIDTYYQKALEKLSPYEERASCLISLTHQLKAREH